MPVKKVLNDLTSVCVENNHIAIHSPNKIEKRKDTKVLKWFKKDIFISYLRRRLRIVVRTLLVDFASVTLVFSLIGVDTECNSSC